MKNWTDIGVKPTDMSIAFLWTNFAGIVLAADVSEIQRNEMRKAFYAGFTECFKVINEYATQLSEKDAITVLGRLNTEAHDFYKKMLADYVARRGGL